MQIEYKESMVLIDECDYELFKSKNWSINRYKGRNNKEYLTCWNGQPIHRQIMGLEKGDGKLVDHANGNGLDNRRCNLRIATRSDNNRNIPANPNRTREGKPKTSRYKGVLKSPNKRKYTAYITVNNICGVIGYFLNENDAARAYNNAAIKHFGEFASLNTIEEIQDSLPMFAS